MVKRVMNPQKRLHWKFTQIKDVHEGIKLPDSVGRSKSTAKLAQVK